MLQRGPEDVDLNFERIYVDPLLLLSAMANSVGQADGANSVPSLVGHSGDPLAPSLVHFPFLLFANANRVPSLVGHSGDLPFSPLPPFVSLFLGPFIWPRT